MMKDVGVPDKMVMDNAKAQVLGQFKRKLREADCWVKRIEPHTPFSNAAEAAIRELKKRTARALTKSKCPKQLWDDCLELTALQRSHTALDLWNLRDEVPEGRLELSSVHTISYLRAFAQLASFSVANTEKCL